MLCDDVNDINAQMEHSQASRIKSLDSDAQFPKHDSPNSKLYLDFNYQQKPKLDAD